MVNSKNCIVNLAIFSLFLLLLIFFLDPSTCKSSFFFSRKDSHTNVVIGKDELQIALEKASMPWSKTVIIAIINRAYVEPHENEFPTMFDLFLEGFWAGEGTGTLLDHLLVVSMDKTAHRRCLFRRLNCYRMAAAGGGGEPDDAFAGEKVFMSGGFIEMMWRRTSFLLSVLKRGYNFIFTDVDVLWLRNPLPRLSIDEPIDLEISTDVFNGNPSSTNNSINTGFYFVKSNHKTISLFEIWYDRRKNSTGHKEQDVLQHLIRHNVSEELGLRIRFLNTLYFSGFCRNSEDVRMVTTVHANCCLTIGAKVMDLKVVLGDWNGYFKNTKNNGISDLGSSKNSTRYSHWWSKHIYCAKSWHNKTIGRVKEI